MMSTMSLVGANGNSSPVGVIVGQTSLGDESRQMASVLEMHKICGVCGDKALGYNFNALTCESCKAFFRRNALRNKVFRCITAGNCILNAKTRKYCRKCRLDKCFAIGMKKDWILTEEEKLLKRRKHRNRDSLERKDADSSSSMMSTMNYCYANESDHSEPSSNSNHTPVNSNGNHISQAHQPTQGHHISLVGQSSSSSGTTTVMNNNVSPGSSLHSPVSSSSVVQSTTTPTMSGIMSTTTPNPASSLSSSTGNPQSYNPSTQQNIIIVPFSLPYGMDNGMNGSTKTDGMNMMSKEHIMNYLKSKLSLNIENATVNFDAVDDLFSRSQGPEVSGTIKQESQASQLPVSSSGFHNHNHSQGYSNQSHMPNFELFKAQQQQQLHNHTSHHQTTHQSHHQNHHSFSDNPISQPTFVTAESNNSTTTTTTTSGNENTPFVSDFFSTQESSMDTYYSGGFGHAHSQVGYNSQQQQQTTVIQELHSHSNGNAQNPSTSLCSSSSSIDVIKSEIVDGKTLLQSSIADHQSSNQNHSQNQQVNHTSSSPSSSPSSASSSSGYLWKISDNVYKHALQLEYTDNPLLARRSDSSEECITALSPLEQQRLDDINEYLTPLFLHVHQPNAPQTVISEILSGMQYFETLVRKIIIAIKNIHSFKCMCQDDQIVLIKGSVGEIKSLLHVRFFNPLDNHCTIPDPEDHNSVVVFRTEYLKKTYGEDLYSRCRSFFHSFRDDWKLDDNIINLMVMIILFFPHRSNLKHREYIMLEYLTYCHLLQRYLQVKYQSVCDYKTVFLNLMSRIEEMRSLNEKCMDLILTLIDPKYQNNFPLTAELFDLDTRQSEAMITET